MKITIDVHIEDHKYLQLHEKCFDYKNKDGYGVEVSRCIPVNIMYQHSNGKIYVIKDQELAAAVVAAVEEGK